MKNTFLTLLLALSFSKAVFAQTNYIPAEPIKDSRDCILNLIAPSMYAEIDAAKIKPTIRIESETSLKEFQDSIEKFWHFRPDVFTNVFNPITNEIFIMN